MSDRPYWFESFQKMFGERDGRLKVTKGEVFGSAGPIKSQLFEPIFCYCGAPGGHVTKGTPIIYVCDNCTDTYGKLPFPELEPTDPNYRRN